MLHMNAHMHPGDLHQIVYGLSKQRLVIKSSGHASLQNSGIDLSGLKPVKNIKGNKARKGTS